jgi:hypothetical protein
MVLLRDGKAIAGWIVHKTTQTHGKHPQRRRKFRSDPGTRPSTWLRGLEFNPLRLTLSLSCGALFLVELGLYKHR